MCYGNACINIVYGGTCYSWLALMGCYLYVLIFMSCWEAFVLVDILLSYKVVYMI